MAMKTIYFAVDEDLERRIEDYRRKQTPIPSRSDAIRHLVREYLDFISPEIPDDFSEDEE